MTLQLFDVYLYDDGIPGISSCLRSAGLECGLLMNVIVWSSSVGRAKVHAKRVLSQSGTARELLDFTRTGTPTIGSLPVIGTPRIFRIFNNGAVESGINSELGYIIDGVQSEKRSRPFEGKVEAV